MSNCSTSPSTRAPRRNRSSRSSPVTKRGWWRSLAVGRRPTRVYDPGLNVRPFMICPSCCHKNLPGDEVCKHCKQPLTPFDLPHPENQLERSVMYDQVKTLKQHPPVT